MPAFRIAPLASARLRHAVLCAWTLGASLAWAQTPAGPPTGSSAGTIKQVEGEVYAGADAARRRLQPGAAVHVGDRLSTGRHGAASVVFKDGTVMALGPDANATVRQFEFDSTTQDGNFLVELLQGSVRMVTGLLAKINPERFKVRTPTAVVGVRGTDFIVEALPEQELLYPYVTRDWRDHSRLRR